ncbi:cytochrome P450 [Sphingomonas sp. CL5.1]|uniref:cytochrome P450 n=1 Tax=Sphingomonas sp. CL5.1 TaxID=2653203 RepID=UPI0015814623|nr:cytochrome P450 [Sphingomonas sp. CL5.1]QKR99785.1 cytochrome P450 [Sphingomonas sp. CL5.1]
MADAAVRAAIPVLDLDLFCDASLRDPFADYRVLRDAGPLVRLTRPDVYAIGRFADVQAALRASDALINGEGVGFSDAFNAPKGMNVIQSDGDLHRRLRSTVTRPLSPARLREVRPDLKAMIVERVRSLAGQGWFDAMAGLARFLPVEAVSHFVGLPAVGRERMLEWAAAAFNVIGPDQEPSDVQSLREAFGFMAGLGKDKVRDGSWAGELFAAARSGRLSMQEAMAAISAYVIPSLDTTILAKGHLLANLARNPDQWALLRARPELIPGVVLEGVRRDSVLRWFSRVAVEDYAVDGATVPRGARVMLLYGCANRDERHYDDPDRFDVTRDARDHLAWGTGPHMCAGMHLARIEMEVLLEALVEADVTLEAGEPEIGANRGLYGFTALPFRLGQG